MQMPNRGVDFLLNLSCHRTDNIHSTPYGFRRTVRMTSNWHVARASDSNRPHSLDSASTRLIKPQLERLIFINSTCKRLHTLRDGDFFRSRRRVGAANCASRFSLYSVTGTIIRFPYLRSPNSLYVLGPRICATLSLASSSCRNEDK